MKLIIKYVLVFSLILILGKAYAQDMQFGGFSFSYMPKASLKTAQNVDRKIGFREFNAFVNIPTSLDTMQKKMLVNGFNYYLVQRFEDNNISNNTEKSNWHKFSYKLSLSTKLKKNWRMTIAATPSIYANFENNKSLEPDDFIMQGMIIFTKRKSKNSQYGFGMIYSSSLGIPLPLPIFMYNFKKNNSNIQITLPGQAAYSHDFSKLRLGIVFRLNGGNYNTNISQSTFPSGINIIDEIRYSRMTIGPEFKYRLTKLMVLNINTGYVFSRSYKLVSEAGQELDFSLNNGFFLRIGFNLSPQPRTPSS